MKNRTAGFWVMLLSVVFWAVGCEKSTESKEAKQLRTLLEKNVVVGEKKEDLLSFFRKNGWDATFDGIHNAYVIGIDVEKKDGLTLHVVMLRVFVENEKVTRFTVSDGYKPPM